MSMSNQFADITWQSRWNDPTKPHIYLSQCGPELVTTGVMGVLRLDLRKSADSVAVVMQLRQLAKAIEDAQLRYTTAAAEWDWLTTQEHERVEDE